jgi:hypothetical protein
MKYDPISKVSRLRHPEPLRSCPTATPSIPGLPLDAKERQSPNAKVAIHARSKRRPNLSADQMVERTEWEFCLSTCEKLYRQSSHRGFRLDLPRSRSTELPGSMR